MSILMQEVWSEHALEHTHELNLNTLLRDFFDSAFEILSRRELYTQHINSKLYEYIRCFPENDVVAVANIGQGNA